MAEPMDGCQTLVIASAEIASIIRDAEALLRERRIGFDAAIDTACARNEWAVQSGFVRMVVG